MSILSDRARYVCSWRRVRVSLTNAIATPTTLPTSSLRSLPFSTPRSCVRRSVGGKSLARGALYLMLQNRIYRGEIVHKQASYPGQHEAIITEALWEEVQRQLAANRNDRATGCTAREPSLLAGLLFDDTGEHMTPAHANKKGTRYRYYVSGGLVRDSRRNAPRGRRVPAGDLEALVEDRLRQFLANEAELFGAIEAEIADGNDRASLVARAADLSH
jgi:site-specific DNA recombinase